RHAAQEEFLLAGGGSAHQLDLRPLQLQGLGQDLDQGLVRAPLVGRCRDGDLEAPGLLADDAVAPGPRLRPHGEHAPLRMLCHLDHDRPSKSTVPSRTCVAPSSTATSKSLLIPIDRYSTRWALPSSPRSRSRSSRSATKVGRHASASCSAAMVISPRSSSCRSRCSAWTSPGTSGGANPCLLASPLAFTSRRTSTLRPCRPASCSSASRRRTLSTEWISRTSGSVRSILLRCRWPIRCQRTVLGSRSALRQSSWGRFSPR